MWRWRLRPSTLRRLPLRLPAAFPPPSSVPPPPPPPPPPPQLVGRPERTNGGAARLPRHRSRRLRPPALLGALDPRRAELPHLRPARGSACMHGSGAPAGGCAARVGAEGCEGSFLPAGRRPYIHTNKHTNPPAPPEGVAGRRPRSRIPPRPRRSRHRYVRHEYTPLSLGPTGILRLCKSKLRCE